MVVVIIWGLSCNGVIYRFSNRFAVQSIAIRVMMWSYAGRMVPCWFVDGKSMIF